MDPRLSPRSQQELDLEDEELHRHQATQPGSTVTISYAAPALVRSQITSWTTLAWGDAIATALFATNAATVLGIVRSDDALKGRHGRGMTLLIAASYGAILFNSIAALASLLVIDRLRGIEFYEAGNKARRTGEGNVPKGFSSWDLLADYGARRHVRWMLIQWAIYSVTGASLMLMQLIVYMWLSEGFALSLTFTVLAGVACVGLFFTHITGKFGLC
ncbi:hypothetical protein DFH08DRAFT_863371 [Mycena albidolilacea]|uniref:Uncharacterized protein n=1 Tax=Mycena albidolilacea TaxID=1033008 RepID=A0AAD7A5I0_9AGAR|nr:hypothetical protein DFH08DRAFT_863371 [Mycena albidolilacea]